MTLLCWSRSSCFNDLFVLFPFMCKCISICKCVYMNSRARGGKMHKVPWTWIHIWLWAAWQMLWKQISDRWERSKYSQLLSDPYNSLELRVNKVLLKNFIFSSRFSLKHIHAWCFTLACFDLKMMTKYVDMFISNVLNLV